MNRRELLKLGGPVAIAVVAGRALIGNPFALLSGERQRTVHEMIEQSGAMWKLRRRNRQESPVIIYFGDGPAAELRQDDSGKWKVACRELTGAESADFNRYIKEVSPRMGSKLGERFHSGSENRIRAWVFNGRKPDEWICSIDYKGLVT